MKPIHVKPNLYSLYFYNLKEVAFKYRYNLVLHGSANRDLDLIAIPWQKVVKPHEEMIQEFADILGGYIQQESEEDRDKFAKIFHGRRNYIINLNRASKFSKDNQDPQYYLDISVTPKV